MNQIIKQVNRARRQMVLSQFIQAFCICVFVGLLIASIGLLVPKIWHLSMLATGSNANFWNWSWIGGGLGLGVLAAIAWTSMTSANLHQAAVEIDERFKLKERLSSALLLSNTERESDAGQALVKDAADRAELIEVGEEFKMSPSRQMLLPILPALLLAGLIFVPNATAKEVAVEPEPEKKNVEVKTAMEETRKKIRKTVEEMEAKGLKDAAK